MKFKFPLVLHVIIAGAAIGVAIGAYHQFNEKLDMVTCGLIGLAASLGITAFIRVLNEL